jgi:hypothetical protein
LIIGRIFCEKSLKVDKLTKSLSEYFIGIYSIPNSSQTSFDDF